MNAANMSGLTGWGAHQLGTGQIIEHLKKHASGVLDANAMQIVEVSHAGEIVERYPIMIWMLNAPVSEQDFVKTAKKTLKVGGYSEEVIAAATFRVLDG